MLTTIRKAFQEALMVLPAEEYDWFDIQTGNKGRPLQSPAGPQDVVAEAVDEGRQFARGNTPTDKSSFSNLQAPCSAFG